MQAAAEKLKVTLSLDWLRYAPPLSGKSKNNDQPLILNIMIVLWFLYCVQLLFDVLCCFSLSIPFDVIHYILLFLCVFMFSAESP